ncbi:MULTISPECIES: hypothetical protein [unclassified Streptomyces]|uniref:hypothetical protein n=1 Tax=unclassified Streptomyces TaxID=2593676 RepID=UPI000C27EEBC|nr:hypothetical protein [Streptomyces sp. CB02613]PJN31305.1 hypothetical protein CG717_16185 [Streptomyces sp. CB02613]
MAALAATRAATLGGIADITAGAAAATEGGDTAPVGPGLFLLAINAGGTSRTITIATPGTVHGHPVADATLVVAAGDTGLIPLTTLFRGTGGRAAITYDAVTSLSVRVLELGA